MEEAEEESARQEGRGEGRRAGRGVNNWCYMLLFHINSLTSITAQFRKQRRGGKWKRRRRKVQEKRQRRGGKWKRRRQRREEGERSFIEKEIGKK